MENNNKLVKTPPQLMLLYIVLVLMGGLLVMLADLQAEKKKFQNYSDIVYHGVTQRLLTAEGVITALVSFGKSSDLENSDQERVLGDLVNAYPYISAIAILDWVKFLDRSGYERDMREKGMAGMHIREYNDANDTFIRAPTRKSYLVTRLLVPLEPETSQLLGLDLLVDKEIKEALSISLKNNAASLVEVPDFISLKHDMALLKNTYFGRQEPKSVLESKRHLNGVIMLYLDQQKIFSSVMDNLPEIDFELALTELRQSDVDATETHATHSYSEKISPLSVVFTDLQQFNIANRDVILKVSSEYEPGMMQLIIAAMVMILIAVILRVWSTSRKQQKLAALSQEEAFQALFTERERAEVTLSSIADAVVTTDDHDRITFLNPVAEKYIGITNSDAFGKQVNEVIKLIDEGTQEAIDNPLRDCIHSARESGEGMSVHLLQKPGGEDALSVDLSCSKLKDIQGSEMGSVIVIRDVTQEMQLKKQLTYQASHDPLTGLVNRTKFEQEVKAAIHTSGDDHLGHALCYMDLDQFKIINDTCGHIAGDALLKQLSRILSERIRDTDVLARLGGDEFGLLLRNCDLENAVPIADTLRLAVRQFIFRWDEHAFDIRMSIGVVAINNPNSTHAELMSAADVACYIAKETGRDYVHAYQPEDESVTQHHELMQWSQKIQDALRTDKFYLMLQTMAPLLSAQADIQIQEFLLRIRMDDGSVVTPATFIPAAERYGLMRDIDMWVIDHTLEIIQDVQQDTDNSVTYLYSINLSGQSVGDPEISDFIIKKIEQYQIDPKQLMLEITETAAITNFQSAMDFIHRLSEIGCNFALDDFGAGLSSFGYLKRMKVHFIKIDGQFVKGMGEDPIDRMMVNNITHLAYGLGLYVIAESVEDETLFNMLRDIGVHFAQGYHIQRPTSIEDWKKENRLKTIFMRTVQ